MGHLGRLKEEYRQLVERLGRAGVALPEPVQEEAWRGWREILEILFTPEEAALAARLPVRPTSLAELSRRFGSSEAQLSERLDPLCDKGLVMDLSLPGGEGRMYLLAPPVTGFMEFSFMRAHDSIPKKRLAEAMDAYFHGDRAFLDELFGRKTVIGRALVRESALADDALPEVLRWERATELVRGSNSLAVSLCYCRHKAEHVGAACSAEKENCLSLNLGAEFVVHRGFGRSIQPEEGLEILARAREGGLVQLADNVVDRPTFLCNCCGCCCDQLRAVADYGLRAVNPSGFWPRLDESRCNGCSRCVRTCPVDAMALEMGGEPKGSRFGLRPHLDEERCIGCGLCAIACTQRALQMARAANAPSHVPVNSVEKAVRMALERGQLAELLVEQGTGLGSRFLHRVVEAIVKLSPTKALLATEQVQSRFVRYALKRYGHLV